LGDDHVRGVQGRYFVIALPIAAIFIASITNVGLPRGALAAMAAKRLGQSRPELADERSKHGSLRRLPYAR
jgi:hypothetical protein